MKEELQEKLKQLTKDMDIPEFRRTSPKWLKKNMVTRNSNHPNYDEAMGIVEKLLRLGV